MQTALKTAIPIGAAQRWPTLPSNGLGENGSGDTRPWWLQLSQPFAEAGAHRLAHGQTPTFGFDYRQSYSGPFGSQYGSQYGGFPTGMSQVSSYMPLIILGIGALLLMRR